MNQDDYERVLGLIRTQAKPDLLRIVRLLRQNGYSKLEMAYGLCFLAQGLADDSLSVQEVTNAMRAGRIESNRNALAEFHKLPTPDNRIPR